MNQSTLLSHAGTSMMNREQIAALPLREPMGSRHRPVPHIEIIQSLDAALYERGLMITKEGFAISRNGNDMFGTMDVNIADVPDFTTSLGFRSSNDQKFPVALVAGARVFVCDNLMFFGQFDLIKKRHTLHLNVREHIEIGIDRFIDQATNNLKEVEALKQREVADETAKAFIFDVFAKKVFPSKLFLDVATEYFSSEQRHESFASRTAWSLVNAFTEVAKTLRPTPRLAALTRLGEEQKTLLN